jgi:Holliday junction resolvasome RuvABC endonuclease subunit
VQQWLGCADPSWSIDATDALALTIVHAHIDAQRHRVPIGAS